MTEPMLQLSELTKIYRVGHKQYLTAVDNVSLSIERGSTLALVGESGSGKSTLARCLLGLVEPTGGEVRLGGKTISGLGAREASRAYRDIQMVFQDPNSSLNPRMSVLQAITEPLMLHLKMPKHERIARACELIKLVNLTEEHLDRMPHELSGGQRQRVGIARAIAVDPQVVILDEPTSSLDVSVRGSILDLLTSLQARLGMSYLFISHDLQAVRYVADRVAVMYLGAIVEQGPAVEILEHPKHPYTRALISASPVPQYGIDRSRIRLAGEIPSPIGLKDECRLAGRCPLVQESCRAGIPPLLPVGPGHSSACPITAAE